MVDLEVSKIIYKKLNLQGWDRKTAKAEIEVANEGLREFFEKNKEIAIKTHEYILKFFKKKTKTLHKGISPDIGAQISWNILIRAFISIDKNLALDENEIALQDPNEKNRNDVLNKIISQDFILNFIFSQDIWTLFAKILIELEQNKILIKQSRRLKSKHKYKTEIFLKFKNIKGLVYSNRILLNICFKPPKITKSIQISHAYTTAAPNFKKSRGGKPFNKFDLNSIKKLTQTPISLNKELLNNQYFIETIYEELNSILGTNSQTKAMEELIPWNIKIKNKIDDFEIETIKLERILANKLSIYNNKFNNKNIGFFKKILLKFYIFQKINIFFKKKAYREISILRGRIADRNSLLQKTLSILVITKLKDINNPIYYTYSRDFRGRFYANCISHPQSNKILRVILSLIDEKAKKYFTKTELINFNLQLSLLKDCPFLKKNHYYCIRTKVDAESPMAIRFLLNILFFEIGKINKIKIYKEGGIEIHEIIAEGCRLYQLTEKCLYFEFGGWDIEERLYCIKYFMVLDEYLKTGRLKKFTIAKDATASALQNWTLVLNYTNKKSLKMLNLEGCRWHDPYTIIIKEFINNNNEYDELYKLKLMERSLLKKTIMTQQYNVSCWSSWNYYKNSIENDLLLCKYMKTHFKQIKKFHDDFYKFLRGEAFSIFFEKKKDVINNNEFKFKALGLDLDFKYKKKDNKKNIIKVVTHNKIRWKFVFSVYENINTMKSEVAFSANAMHALDALLVDNVSRHIRNIPIHDSFIIEVEDTIKLLDHINKHYNSKLQTKKSYIIVI